MPAQRLRPLVLEEMTPEQPWIADRIVAGPRGSLQGPFQPMLRSPALADVWEPVGAHVRSMLDRHEVSDAEFAAVNDRLGERGVVELLATMGHYCMVSMILNADRHPIPDGAVPLAPLPGRKGGES